VGDGSPRDIERPEFPVSQSEPVDVAVVVDTVTDPAPESLMSQTRWWRSRDVDLGEAARIEREAMLHVVVLAEVAVIRPRSSIPRIRVSIAPG
jgi:hypothetical protein